MAGKWLESRDLVDDAGKRVVAELGVPEKVSEHEWRCPYRVVRGRAGKVRHGHGVDAFQALIQGLAGIRAALDEAGPVRWEGGTELGETGFPMFIPQVAFTRSLEQRVQIELERFAKEIPRRTRVRST